MANFVAHLKWIHLSTLLASCKMSHKKQIFKLRTLRKMMEGNGCVSLVQSTRLLALPPFFLNDLKSGILYELNSLLKKYDGSLGGVIIGYQNIKLIMDENTGIIPMGTPETEVNIKVEFYVFQPKIGSYLEGIINNKSTTHVGCLVHKYFNATILKPDEVDYEDWVCSKYQLNDKITFRVKDLDFSNVVPSIEGIVDDENLLIKNKSPEGPTDASPSDGVICSINNISSTSELLSKIEKNKDSDYEFIVQEKRKGKNNTHKNKSFQEIVNSIEDNSSRTDGKKEKKKRKIEPTTETVIIKEKKKKKEKGSDATSFNPGYDIDNEKAERYKKAVEGSLSLGKYVELENENSNDFMTPVKLTGKKKKKKEKDDKSFNKTFEIHSKGEDNVLYSTRLEPNSGSKMSLSFCSPIPCGSSRETQDGETAFESPSSAQTSKNKPLDKGQEKKKSKQRKREEESELVPKKVKTSTLSPDQKMGANTEKAETEKMIEEFYKRQLSLIEDTSSLTYGESPTKKMELSRNKSFPKLKVGRDSDPDISSVAGVTGLDREHDRLDGLFHQIVKTSVSAENVHSKKEAVKKRKKSNKSKLSGSDVDGEIDTVRSKLNELNNEEIKSPIKSQKPEKKSKTSESEKSEMEEVISDLHYKNLARSGLSSENEKQSSFQQSKVGKRKNKKDSELSDLSTTSSKKRSSLKKSKQKEKTKGPIISETYINGSMYDIYYSPEKFDPDKSLFTDSEQSQSSPVKKRKAMNSMEDALQKSPKVQNMLCDLSKNDQTGQDSSLDEESSKHLGKSGKGPDHTGQTTSSKKRSSLKQSKHKEKAKGSIISETYNGSIYGVHYSPEKFNPDLSEQRQSSPVKKKKKTMNGMEDALQTSPKVQNMLSDLSKNDQTGQDSSLDEESSKHLSNSDKSKKESKQKVKNSGEGNKSLFEKLLQQAKRSIDFKGDHSS